MIILTTNSINGPQTLSTDYQEKLVLSQSVDNSPESLLFSELNRIINNISIDLSELDYSEHLSFSSLFEAFKELHSELKNIGTKQFSDKTINGESNIVYSIVAPQTLPEIDFKLSNITYLKSGVIDKRYQYIIEAINALKHEGEKSGIKVNIVNEISDSDTSHWNTKIQDNIASNISFEIAFKMKKSNVLGASIRIHLEEIMQKFSNVFQTQKQVLFTKIRTHELVNIDKYGLWNNQAFEKKMDESLKNKNNFSVFIFNVHNFNGLFDVCGLEAEKSISEFFTKILPNHFSDESQSYRIEGGKYYVTIPSVKIEEIEKMIRKFIEESLSLEIQKKGTKHIAPLILDLGLFVHNNKNREIKTQDIHNALHGLKVVSYNENNLTIPIDESYVSLNSSDIYPEITTKPSEDIKEIATTLRLLSRTRDTRSDAGFDIKRLASYVDETTGMISLVNMKKLMENEKVDLEHIEKLLKISLGTVSFERLTHEKLKEIKQKNIQRT